MWDNVIPPPLCHYPIFVRRVIPVLGKTENVYVIDPDAHIRERVAALLGTLDIPVTCYTEAQQFLEVEAPRNWASGCIVVAAELHKLSCPDFLHRLRGNGNTLPVLVLASTADRSIADQALTAGATCVVDKPLNIERFLEQLYEVMPESPGLEAAVSRHFIAKNGVTVTVRTIRPEDARIEQAFVQNLSARSRFMRFFSSIKKLSPAMLDRFIRPSYPRSWALIATIDDAGQEKAIGVARYAPTDSEERAEFAIVVADEWQHLGVAHFLLSQLIATAEGANIQRLGGLVLRQNTEMLHLAKKLGFTAKPDPKDATVLHISRDLSGE